MNLRTFFPTTNAGAQLYGGFIYDKWHFGRIFKITQSFEKTLGEINQFLDLQGYSTKIQANISDDSFEIEDQNIQAWLNPYAEDEIVLVIQRDANSKEVPELLIKVLEQFRNERDWAQFHNPKDLAIALSIETSELLELFLWKKHEEANKEKIKEELADIFAYALLLLNKYDLNIEDIVLKKVQSNAEKYPVHKARGNASKYTEL